MNKKKKEKSIKKQKKVSRVRQRSTSKQVTRKIKSQSVKKKRKSKKRVKSQQKIFQSQDNLMQDLKPVQKKRRSKQVRKMSKKIKRIRTKVSNSEQKSDKKFFVRKKRKKSSKKLPKRSMKIKQQETIKMVKQKKERRLMKCLSCKQQVMQTLKKSKTKKKLGRKVKSKKLLMKGKRQNSLRELISHYQTIKNSDQPNMKQIQKVLNRVQDIYTKISIKLDNLKIKKKDQEKLAAVKIQKIFRGYRMRKRYRMREIQTTVRKIPSNPDQEQKTLKKVNKDQDQVVNPINSIKSKIRQKRREVEVWKQGKYSEQDLSCSLLIDRKKSNFIKKKSKKSKISNLTKKVWTLQKIENSTIDMLIFDFLNDELWKNLVILAIKGDEGQEIVGIRTDEFSVKDYLLLLVNEIMINNIKISQSNPTLPSSLMISLEKKINQKQIQRIPNNSLLTYQSIFHQSIFDSFNQVSKRMFPSYSLIALNDQEKLIQKIVNKIMENQMNKLQPFTKESNQNLLTKDQKLFQDPLVKFKNHQKISINFIAKEIEKILIQDIILLLNHYQFSIQIRTLFFLTVLPK